MSTLGVGKIQFVIDFKINISFMSLPKIPNEYTYKDKDIP